MMHIRLNGVRLGLNEPETDLTVKIAALLGITTAAIADMKIVLEAEGYSVAWATNGVEAIQKAKAVNLA